MRLEPSIADTTSRLRQGKFPNEQAISQGIVLRILQELGWNTWETSCIWPQYQTGEGRADFALCHPPGKPAVCIEVKQPGKPTPRPVTKGNWTFSGSKTTRLPTPRISPNLLCLPPRSSKTSKK